MQSWRCFQHPREHFVPPLIVLIALGIHYDSAPPIGANIMPVSLEELQLRLKRIYSSIDATIDSDLSNLRPTEIPGGFLMNFSQGKSNEELQNMVWNMIHTTAIFFGHCSKRRCDKYWENQIVLHYSRFGQ